MLEVARERVDLIPPRCSACPSRGSATLPHVSLLLVWASTASRRRPSTQRRRVGSALPLAVEVGRSAESRARRTQSSALNRGSRCMGPPWVEPGSGAGRCPRTSPIPRTRCSVGTRKNELDLIAIPCGEQETSSVLCEPARARGSPGPTPRSSRLMPAGAPRSSGATRVAATASGGGYSPIAAVRGATLASASRQTKRKSPSPVETGPRLFQRGGRDSNPRPLA